MDDGSDDAFEPMLVLGMLDGLLDLLGNFEGLDIGQSLKDGVNDGSNVSGDGFEEVVSSTDLLTDG